MPNLRLRIRHGEIVDKLPGHCLFCGKRVLDFRLRVVQAGQQQHYLQLPLCDEDRKEGKLSLEQPNLTAGLGTAPSHPFLFLLFASLFQLFRAASKPKNERNHQMVVIAGVCPEFLDAFEELNEPEKADRETEEAGENGSPKKNRVPLFWILGGVGGFGLLFVCCGGAALVGIARQRGKQQQQNVANPAVQPPRMPAPAIDREGGLPQPPPRPPIANAPPAEEAKGAPGEIRPTLQGHTGNVVGLTYRPKGDVLISAGEDGSVRWWRFGDNPAPQPTQRQAANDKLYGLALSPDGELMAATSWHGNVVTLNGAGGGAVETLETRTGKVALGLAFSSDSKTLLTGHFGHTIKVWDVPSRKLRATLKGSNDWTMAIAYSPDGKLFATTGGLPDDSIMLWDAVKQQSIATLKGHKVGKAGAVRYLTFAPDSKTLASAADDGTARLWDVAEQRERFTLTHPEKQVCGVAFTPDGALVVTGCQDGQVRLWDTASGRQRGGTDLPMVRFVTPAVTAIAVSPDGKSIASGNGRFIRRWNLAQLLK